MSVVEDVAAAQMMYRDLREAVKAWEPARTFCFCSDSI